MILICDLTYYEAYMLQPLSFDDNHLHFSSTNQYFCNNHNIEISRILRRFGMEPLTPDYPFLYRRKSYD